MNFEKEIKKAFYRNESDAENIASARAHRLSGISDEASRRGLFGSTNNYDAKGHKVGRTDPGFFGGSNHYDNRGRKIGDSNPGFFGSTHTRLDEEDD